jgi:cullin-associated NEDD8-dissociated protein 1
MNPKELLPKLQLYLKLTFSQQPQSIDPLLKECIGDFLKTLEDGDLNVRRVAFNQAAHNNLTLVRNLLDQVLPQLYNETKVKTELIRDVEMEDIAKAILHSNSNEGKLFF